MQLLHDPLLVGGRQTAEAGIAAQGPFLLLGGKISVLIEPVAQMNRRSLGGLPVSRIRETGRALTRIALA
jgi:hypothetical protein